VKINDYGQVSITEQEAFDALYSGRIINVDNVHLENTDVIEKFNSSVKSNADRIPLFSSPKDLTDISKESFDQENQNNWFMPNEYKDMDIEGFLVDQCPKQHYDRLVEELVLFRQHNMLPLLKYLKYLVDTLRENNILWGVGRGSSVASYVLFLIGVHKIDSIKYNLDIKEFLK
jgi:DNA polymerase III alpha subunit